MVLFCRLSPTFCLLLLAPPVLSEPQSANDPLRAIAISGYRPPNEPVCCLKPLTPLEHVEEELLPLFEDWKAKQLSAQQERQRTTTSKDKGIAVSSSAGVTGGVALSLEVPKPSEILSDQPGATPTGVRDFPDLEVIAPHFRVPLTDRFNYASLECSARVHLTHRSAKSPSAILSSKRDRYMLSPCTPPSSSSNQQQREKQFVVVELCSDIRIDTVQLANFEFFSGVFQEFTVSVAKTYTTDPDGWTNAGTYHAKNIRGSFHPPTSLRDFYRYIRIDFHSHYGNEYYCPVSLLRVYGLTHLEEWKWDVWEAESRAKRDFAGLEEKRAVTEQSTSATVHRISAPAAPVTPVPASLQDGVTEKFLEQPSQTVEVATGEVSQPSLTSTNDDDTDANFANPTLRGHIAGIPVLTTSVMSEPSATIMSSDPDGVHEEPLSITDTDTAISSQMAQGSNSHVDEDSQNLHTTHNHNGQTARTIDPKEPSSIFAVLSLTSTPTPTSSNSSTVPAEASEGSTIFESIHPATTRSSSSMPPLPPPVPLPTGGESIYRTIMNRLTVLEANHTLHARYVEEQTAGIRELLRRLGEDIGRLEGIGKAQAQMHQRTVQDWERQRRRLEMEHGELMSRVSYLADELVLEKRLGIAQLCLLLTVLVFMALTRGSRGEALISMDPVLQKSMRDWGRRTLSLHGDWVKRLRSQSFKPTSIKQEVAQEDGKQVKVEFPLQSPQSGASSGSKGARRFHAQQPRSRTPSLRTLGPRSHSAQSTNAGIPSGVNAVNAASPCSRSHSQPVHRTSSHGVTDGATGIVSAPRSAKKWARSAHLHEVRGKVGRQLRKGDDERTSRGRLKKDGEAAADVLTAAYGRGRARSLHGEDDRPLWLVNDTAVSLPSRVGRLSDGSDSAASGGEVDAWIDTDVDGSEADSEVASGQSPLQASRTLRPLTLATR